jgi:thiol-disulfide isomerase/thioredoxin
VKQRAAHARPGRRAWLLRAGALAAAGAGMGAVRPSAAQAQLTLLPEGTRVPGATALDLEGRHWTLPPTGRAGVVNLWASWCEPCRAEMPALAQLASSQGDRLHVLALNFKERPETAARFAARHAIGMPVLLDREGAIARQWAVRIFPTTLGFAADGQLVWRVQGEYDWAGAQAMSLIARLVR